MRPIEKGTLVRLRAKLEEARDAEYRAVLDLANSPVSVADQKLSELNQWRITARDIQECINRLERDGLVSAETTEAEVYASKEQMPTEGLGDW